MTRRRRCWQVLPEQRRLLNNETDEFMQHLAVIYDPERLGATLDACSSGVGVGGGGDGGAASSGAAAAMNLCVHCARKAVLRCSRCRQQHYCGKYVEFLFR